MSDNHQPTRHSTQGLFGKARRAFTLLVAMAETRLRLVVLELEEEKAHLILLFLIAGATLLLLIFGIISLFLMILFFIEPPHRLLALGITTLILFSLAFCGAFWSIHLSRQSTLLKTTRQQLKIDRQQLEEKR